MGGVELVRKVHDNHRRATQAVIRKPASPLSGCLSCGAKAMRLEGGAGGRSNVLACVLRERGLNNIGGRKQTETSTKVSD